MGILAHNPSDALQRPRVARHEMVIMPDRDIHLFLEFALSTEYYPLFYTLLFCHYDGAPYRPDTISQAWRKLAVKIAVDDILLPGKLKVADESIR